MRLTNVAHMRLPFGKLWGYEVSVSPLGDEIPVSADQRRHVGAGNRVGSWMALSFRLGAPVPRGDLAKAWLAVIERHGTLRSVFRPGADGEPHAYEVTIGPGTWVEHPIGPGEEVNDVLRDVLDQSCGPYRTPSHRLCVLETAAGPTIIIGTDHSHVDMWSMLVVLRDFLDELAAVRGGGQTPSLKVAPDFADHTRMSRGDAPADVSRRWEEILQASGGALPTFPLPLGDPGPQLERVEVRDVFDANDSAGFTAQARSKGISTLSLAVSAMTEVTRDLADQPLRAVFPVHSRFDEKWHDAVGWFISNSVLESTDPAPDAASAAVREAVKIGAHPPHDGTAIPAGMFAISWLDLRRLPVKVDSVGVEAQYVGAAIRTNGVMLWYILDETGVHLRCRYPDTPEARLNVGTWLDELVRRMQEHARLSAGRILAVDKRKFRVQRATRADITQVVALLSRDERVRNVEEERFLSAFESVQYDPSHYLAAIHDENDHIVGTMQLTIVPGLTRSDETRMEIERFAVARSERNKGLGGAMLRWAHARGRARGATYVQVSDDGYCSHIPDLCADLGYDTGRTVYEVGL